MFNDAIAEVAAVKLWSVGANRMKYPAGLLEARTGSGFHTTQERHLGG